MSASATRWIWLAALPLAAGVAWWLGDAGRSQGEVAQPQAAEPAPIPGAEELRRAERAAIDRSPEPEPAQPVEVSAREPAAVAEEPGLASLDLRVLDRADGQGLASKVELWQLDLPQDAEFQAGNHLRDTIDVHPEGGRVEELPPGRYRALVFRRARSTEDPPEFVLRAGENQIDLYVDPPTDERWWVRVVDEFGRPLEKAEERGNANYTQAQRVGFAVQRRRLGDDSILVGGGGGGRYGVRARRAAKPEGFDLGVWREPTPGVSITRVPRLRFDGRFDVDCRVKGWVCARFGKREDDALPQRHFVAVSLSRNYFDSSFCDPRGAPVQREQVQVKVEADLVEVESGTAVPVDELSYTVRARWNGGEWSEWNLEVRGGPPQNLRLSQPSED